eukprot:gene31791-38430_t
MCCIISGEPVEDSRGKIKTYSGPNKFQASMMEAPCADGCTTCCWFLGQCIPVTCACTQYALRRKVLGGDMTKYSCFQGYFNICCLQAGTCGEQSCPDFCLCVESCCCNFAAVSASRMYVMEKYDLTSDPCDYRLIRINNCLQILACVCDILAIFIADLRNLANIIDMIANIFYHCVSGCMTAQVAHEVNYQTANGPGAGLASSEVIHATPVNKY